MLSPTASKALLDVTFLSDRVGLASFALKDRRLHVICAYAPTAPRTTEAPSGTEEFYATLGSICDSLSERDIPFVVGDFNAPLPPDGHLVKNACGRPNNNSSLLSCFIESRNLVAVNAFLRQRLCKLTRLDWILFPSIMKQRLRKVINIWPQCINSDHNLVLCEADLRWPHLQPPRPQPLWSALDCPATQTAFVHRMMSASPNLAESAASFSRAVNAAAASLPERKADKSKALWDCDPVIAEGRRQVQSAVVRNGQDSDEARAARHRLQEIYAERAEALVTEAVREIQLATDTCRHNAAWRAIDRLTGRKSRPHTVVAAASINQRKAHLAAHFRKVLNAPAPSVSLLPVHDFEAAPSDSFNTDTITIEEVKRALRTTRTDTAPGVDSIPPQVLKINDLAPTITSLLNANTCIGGGDDME